MAGGDEQSATGSSQQQQQRQSNTNAGTVSQNNNIFHRIEFPRLDNERNIEYWFIRLESWFKLQNIGDSIVRFEAVVSTLTSQLFDQVVEIISNPPEENPYGVLKAALIRKFADSEHTRVDKLLSTVPLGAQRPSHLLAEIRRAGATSDENILKVCWLRRLPVEIRSVISAAKVPLTELAEMADSTFDTLQPRNTLNAIDSNGTSTSQLVQCLENLSRQINELKFHGRNSRSANRSGNARDRSSSRNSRAGQICWFHKRFGARAQKCNKPCNFQSTPRSTNHQ